jgi:DNA-3-methyladenine glycosylase
VEGCLHSTRGPGNLCHALAIRREHDNGRDLTGDDLFVEDAPRPGERIRSGRRVNVDYAGPWAEKPWRYALEGNPWVSRRIAPGGRGEAATPRTPRSLRGGLARLTPRSPGRKRR